MTRRGRKPLSPEVQEVIKLLSEKLPYNAVARLLNINIRTVKRYSGDDLATGNY